MGHALHLGGIAKSYGGNVVLRDVDLTVEPGEIHALLGENGAGKSTLIKILAGVERRDAGEISVGGTVLPQAHDPHDVQRAGVAFVHQQLGLLDGLSVADNVGLALGFPRTRLGIDRSAQREGTTRLLRQVGNSDIHPDTPVGSLTQDEKVLVALARALAADARVVVLDEVSASLPAPEMQRLASVLLQAKGRGIAYVYVTHRLNEVYDFADRITVLRDGDVVLRGSVGDIPRRRAVEAIVGRRVPGTLERAPERAPERTPAGKAADALLEVRGLVGEGIRRPVDLKVGRGEVLGVCGLVGSGIRSLARLLGGAERPRAGRAVLDGMELPLGRPAALHRAGCAYLPGRRAREGILPNLTVRENLFPLRTARGAFSARGLLRRSEESRRAAAYAGELQVRPPDSLERPVRQLSGGNQQKVLLGRALADHPRLLVLEDPTAGVDVGSRQVLHELVRSASAAGTAVILVSTDYEEIASEADRVLVLCDGVAVTEMEGAHVTADRLARVSHGSAAGAATANEGTA